MTQMRRRLGVLLAGGVGYGALLVGVGVGAATESAIVVCTPTVHQPVQLNAICVP